MNAVQPLRQNDYSLAVPEYGKDPDVTLLVGADAACSLCRRRPKRVAKAQHARSRTFALFCAVCVRRLGRVFLSECVTTKRKKGTRP